MDDKRLSQISARVASGKVRTAGKIEFVKDTGPVRRDVRVEDFEWSPDSLRNLAKILWSTQRAHSYAMAALRLFSKIPSSQISPDGLLGGRGYIQSIKDMRTGMSSAVEALSSFTDTLHDEVSAAHWKGSDAEQSQVTGIVEDAAQVKANPEQFVQEQFQEEEGEDAQFENPQAVNPEINNPASENGWSNGEEEEEEGSTQTQLAGSYAETALKEQKIKKRKEENPEEGSKLPGGTGEQGEGMTIPEMVMHTTTPELGNRASSRFAPAWERILRAQEARLASTKTADSSVDPAQLPGPRIKHIGPGESDFNPNEEWASDDPTGEMLSSGVNQGHPLYEDGFQDGVTGYDNVTDSDNSMLQTATKIAAAPQTYSWLPGADNNKNLDYYQLGLSEDDLNWMRQNNAPDPPPGLYPKKPKPELPDMWGNTR